MSSAPRGTRQYWRGLNEGRERQAPESELHCELCFKPLVLMCPEHLSKHKKEQACFYRYCSVVFDTQALLKTHIQECHQHALGSIKSMFGKQL